MTDRIRRFADQDSAAATLAADIINLLGYAVALRGGASLALPGGSTPVPLFEHLSAGSFDWTKVTVLPTDERWVFKHSAASNEGQIRRYIAGAKFVSLKTRHRTPESALQTVSSRLAALPDPLDMVVIGMGEDGHIASLFPGANSDGDGGGCLAAHAPHSPQARISLSLTKLMAGRHLALLFGGAAKWQVFSRGSGLPVHALLPHPRLRVYVYDHTLE